MTAPSMFTKRQVGTTLVNRTEGTKIASEGLKGRVFQTHGPSILQQGLAQPAQDLLRPAHPGQSRMALTWVCCKKMCEIIIRDVTNSELREVVNKLIPDSIAKDIEKACHGIYPLKDVCVRKVKVLKRPCFEICKLMELHGEGGGGKRGEAGDKSERPEGYEPPVQESVLVNIR